MNGIILYRWILGSQANFLEPFAAKPAPVFNEAVTFWANLGNYAPIGFLIGIFLSIIMVYGYYKPFNEMAGRHYLPKYWYIFLGLTALFVFVATYGTEVFIIKTNLENIASYELKLAFANTLYSVVWYVLGSIVFCKAFTTNAYKMF